MLSTLPHFLTPPSFCPFLPLCLLPCICPCKACPGLIPRPSGRPRKKPGHLRSIWCSARGSGCWCRRIWGELGSSVAPSLFLVLLRDPVSRPSQRPSGMMMARLGGGREQNLREGRCLMAVQPWACPFTSLSFPFLRCITRIIPDQDVLCSQLMIVILCWWDLDQGRSDLSLGNGGLGWLVVE